MRNFTRYQLPIIIWAAIIFWLSSLTKLPIIRTPFIAADKLAHMTIFFIFCWLSRRALFFQTTSAALKRYSLMGAFVLSCIYGYFDEVHQIFVPGRTYDYFDMFADAMGALMFIALFIITDRWKRQQTV